MHANVSVSEMALNRVIVAINMPCHVQEPAHHRLRHSTRTSYIDIIHRLQKLKQRQKNVRLRRGGDTLMLAKDSRAFRTRPKDDQE